MAERAFSASYDSMTKAVSVVVCLLLIAVATVVHIIFIALLFPLLIALAYAYSPRGYVLTEDAIVIKRLIGDVRVPLAGIREIRAGTPADFTGCIRIWGNGGLFGYYGLFRTARLGKCSWYVTNRGKTVIVSTQSKVLVLSPDDVEGFIAAARVTSPIVASGGNPQFEASGSFAGKILWVGIAAVVIALVALSLTYSPGPPGYTLSNTGLTIHDRFYPVTLQRDAIDGDGIRIVDLAQDSAWRPTARTNGFANRNYQSGWFRVANGRKVRLYRAGGNRLVLIPPKGNGDFVLYQAKDPDAFVQELRQWTGTSNPASRVLPG